MVVKYVLRPAHFLGYVIIRYNLQDALIYSNHPFMVLSNKKKPCENVRKPHRVIKFTTHFIY